MTLSAFKLGVLLATVATVPVFAAPVTEAEFRSWVAAQIERATKLQFDAPVKLSWKAEALPYDAEMVASWRRTVEGKPEHPLRLELEAAERRIRRGPDRIESALYIQTRKAWRMCETLDYMPETPYFDSGMNQSDSWALNAQTMTAMGADATSREGSTPEERIRQSTQNATSFLSQGLTCFLPRGLDEQSQVTVTGERTSWSAVIRANSGWVTTLRGSCLEDGSTLILAEATGQAKEGERPVVAVDNVRAAKIDLVNGVVAISFRQRSGNETMELRDFAAELVPADRFANFIATPDPLGTDPVRGKLEIHGVNDFRAGRRFVTAKTSEGWKRFDLQEREGSGSTFRWVGWISAGVLVGLIVVLRLRRGGASGT